MNQNELQNAFATMAAIRATEQSLLRLFAEGAITGTVHTCIGQEATAYGVISQIDKARDIVLSNHRGHGHFLAYCEDYEGLVAEVIGLPSGVCGGLGGSQHLHHRNFYSNGILGGMSAVGCGMAHAEKSKGSGACVLSFHGDGAMAEGIIYESLNFAGIWQLPIIFCIEHNQYAQSTPWQVQHAGDLARRAETFGVAVTVVDGNDVGAVTAASRAAIAAARNNKPQMLFMNTYRLAPHSKGDDNRDRDEIAAHAARCPLTRLRNVLDQHWCDEQLQAAVNSANALADKLKEQLRGNVSR